MGFLGISEQLLRTAEERKRHVAALRDVVGDSVHDRLFAFIYDNLSILDSKASSLLSFNAIGLAVLTIFITDAEHLLIALAYYFCMLLLLASCVMCLTIVRVHWSTTEDISAVDAHIEKLLSVRRIRTTWYRTAWVLALGTIFLFVLVTLVQVLAKHL